MAASPSPTPRQGLLSGGLVTLVAEGIALPADVIASLRGLAEDVGLDPEEFNLKL